MVTQTALMAPMNSTVLTHVQTTVSVVITASALTATGLVMARMTAKITQMKRKLSVLKQTVHLIVYVALITGKTNTIKTKLHK